MNKKKNFKVKLNNIQDKKLNIMIKSYFNIYALNFIWQLLVILAVFKNFN